MKFKFVCFHCPMTARAQYSMFFIVILRMGNPRCIW